MKISIVYAALWMKFLAMKTSVGLFPSRKPAAWPGIYCQRLLTTYYGTPTNIEKVKYIQLYLERQGGDTSLDRYDQVLQKDGVMRRIRESDKTPNGSAKSRRFQLTSLISDGDSSKPQLFEFRNRKYIPKENAHWKTDVDNGLRRLESAERIEQQGDRIRYIRFANDFNFVPLSDRWESVQIGKQTIYVVQTSELVVERCMMMTTDPGDLVLDPDLW